jgi:hypothetical protein
MMLKTKNLYAGIAMALALVAPAAAQITAPREAAQIAFGPVSLYPTLQVVDAGVDENVFNDGTEPQSDYTFTVNSRLLSVVRLGLNELLFQTGNDYVWFQDFDRERSNNAHYAMRFNLSASRLKPYIGFERTRTRARRSPEIDVRARRLERSVVGGLGFDLTTRTGLTASARFDDSTYDEGEVFRDVALDTALNRRGRTFDAGFRYAITPLTTISVLAGYDDQTFPESHLRDVTRYTVGPTVDFSPEAAIRGRASAVIERFMPDDPTLGERTGIAYNASLNWALYERTTFDLSAGRNISYSYLDTEPYYLLNGARLTVGQPIFGRLQIYGGFDWEQMAYRWQRGAPADSADRVDTVRTGSAGVLVNLGRGFSVRVGAEKTRRRSVADPRQNFNRTRLVGSVVMGS